MPVRVLCHLIITGDCLLCAWSLPLSPRRSSPLREHPLHLCLRGFMSVPIQLSWYVTTHSYVFCLLNDSLICWNEYCCCYTPSQFSFCPFFCSVFLFLIHTRIPQIHIHNNYIVFYHFHGMAVRSYQIRRKRFKTWIFRFRILFDVVFGRDRCWCKFSLIILLCRMFYWEWMNMALLYLKNT